MNGLKAQALARFARAHGLACTRFDYSGHGASSGPFEDGTIGRWLHDASAVFTRLTEGPQILIGSSMGGWLALLMAHRLNRKGSAQEAGRLAGLVLIAPAIDMTQTLIWNRLDRTARKSLKKRGGLDYQSPWEETPFRITHRLVKKGRKHCFSGGPVDVRCPVHILHGQRDADVPAHLSLALAGQLATDRVRLTLIKDGNHRLSRPQDMALLRDITARMIKEMQE